MVNKEKKAGFNIIDLIIVLFVIFAAVGIFWRFNLADIIRVNATGDIFEIEFVTLFNIQEDSQDYLTVGEKFHVNAVVEIGEIIEVLDIRNPAKLYGTDMNGNIIQSELPGRIDVRGVMRATGRINDENNIMINGNIYAAANKEFFVHTGKWEGWIKVVSITKTN